MEPHWMALAALRTLTVLVYDYAGVSDASVDEMERVGTVLLSRAGIETQWVHCRGHQQGGQPALCGASLDTASVRLRILMVYPGDRTGRLDPLGMALVGGNYASIYAFMIHKYAAHNRLPAGNLMAYAATHEFGHLLLGPNHSPSGIMRASWGRTEYRAMAQHLLDFSDAERQALQRAVPATDQRLARLR